jgi:6-phosphogluconolactonase
VDSTTQWVAAGLIVAFLSAGCGGASNSVTVPPPPPPPPVVNGPASGEYILEGNSGSSLNLLKIDTMTGAISAPILASQTPANDASSYQGVVITPSNAYLYALYTSFTVVQGFQLTGPGLNLVTLAGAPYFPGPSAGPFNSMTMHPSGKFLYVIESPARIEEFRIHTGTGDLASASVVTESADFRVAVIDPAGKFLFVNDLTGGRIYAYGIDSSSGALSAVAGSPFMVPAGGQPILDVIDGVGRYLYAPLFHGGVAAFLVDGTSGALTDVVGSPFPTPYLPSAVTISPSGKFLYVADFTDGAVGGFVIDRNTGALTPAPGTPFSAARSPSNVVIDSTGTFLYESSYPDSIIYGFHVDPSSGSLSALAGSPFPSVANPTNLMVFRIP